MMELNGFSNYQVENCMEKEIENFTLTMIIAPYTYETVKSGIISAFSDKEQKGLLLSVSKQGHFYIKMGLDKGLFEMSDLTTQLDYQKNNIVTISFWGEAGWCDLLINGTLSHRKQMPRHSKLCIPEGECYIGKYVEYEWQKDRYHGAFHGNLTVLSYEEVYTSYDKIMQYHREITLDELEIDLYKNVDVKKDIYRPTFHLMPPAKWMNEPHAPLYYNGYYHIFYQANPHAPVWDNICWGHLRSKDMMCWEDMGIALSADNGHDEIDGDGCWSGSSYIDKNGVPFILYTAGNNQFLPNQSVALARPVDQNDLELKQWNKSGVLIRQVLDQGFLGEFRDPFVFIRNGIYYILVGSGDKDNGGGNALVYSSEDLKDFTCHGFLMDYDYEISKEVGHVWELPVLLPLYNKDKQHICDIVLLCACQIESEIVETYYYLGHFDEAERKFHKFHDKPMLLDLGNGTFTGPSGFVTPDLRSVVFTIAQGKRPYPGECEAGWAHNGGMPVALSIENEELVIEPIAEAAELFTKILADGEYSCEREKLEQTELLENHFVAKTDADKLMLHLQYESGEITVSYDKNTGILKAEQDGKVISKCRGEIDLVAIGDEPIVMEGYIDHSLIEIYLNHKKSISLRNYLYTSGYSLSLDADRNVEIIIWGR